MKACISFQLFCVTNNVLYTEWVASGLILLCLLGVEVKIQEWDASSKSSQIQEWDASVFLYFEGVDVSVVIWGGGAVEP